MLRVFLGRRKHQNSASAGCLDQIFPVFVLYSASSSPGVRQLPWPGAQDALWRHRDRLCS